MANVKKRKVKGFQFKPFSEKQKKILNWWHKDSPVNDRFMVIADGAIRSGKEQSVDSILFTPNGYTTFGEIKPNDVVFNRKGNPVKVLNVYPQGIKDVYRITFHDGSTTECGKEHLWTYTTKKCISNKNYTMFTSTLGEIMQDLERFKDRTHMFERAGKYHFPMNGCVQFNAQEVKIDPYLLGLLLGDGCFSEGNSGISFTNEEQELHDYMYEISKLYNMEYKYVPRKGTHCAFGRIQTTNSLDVSHGSPLRKLLEEYNLYGKKSETKFVPNEYKFNSKEVRLQILAGLLNTDGSVHVKNRPSISFCSVSKQLLDDVVFLARSLGMFVNSDKKPDFRQNKSKNICYSCTIRINNDLYKLLSSKHKSRLNMDTTKDEVWRIIKSIEYVGKKECLCIEVDDEEHLYLTNDFIVTHNTVCMSLSFVMFVMNNFNQQDALMAGKSVGTFRRNVLNPLKQMLLSLEYDILEHRSENYLEITKGKITNYFYIAGAKDEASQDYIQGMTLCGVLLDEVALLPESFFNQATARLSIEGAKVFCNCNPASPYHWFYKNVLQHLEEKQGLYVHFTMDDNLSLSEKVKLRYANMYQGVFKKRYILGRWCNAEGLIYDMFTAEKNVVKPNEIPYDEAIKWCVGVDYGTANATAFLLCMKTFNGYIYAVREYYFEGRKEAQENGDYDTQKTDLEFTDDMIEFLSQSYEYTQIPYNKMDIVVDPAAASFKVQLHRSGMRTRDARNAVLDGIRDVASYMAEGKLKICSECKVLLKEIHTYVWDDKAQERGIDRPVKKQDHMVDGLRYALEKLKDKNSIKDAAKKVGI